MHALLGLIIGFAIGCIVLFIFGTIFYVFEVITERYY